MIWIFVAAIGVAIVFIAFVIPRLARREGFWADLQRSLGGYYEKNM